MEAAGIEPAQDLNRGRRSVLLAKRELYGLLPRHRSSLFERRGRSLLTEPGTGRAEVPLTPRFEDSRPRGDALK